MVKKPKEDEPTEPLAEKLPQSEGSTEPVEPETEDETGEEQDELSEEQKYAILNNNIIKTNENLAVVARTVQALPTAIATELAKQLQGVLQQKAAQAPPQAQGAAGGGAIQPGFGNNVEIDPGTGAPRIKQQQGLQGMLQNLTSTPGGLMELVQAVKAMEGGGQNQFWAQMGMRAFMDQNVNYIMQQRAVIRNQVKQGFLTPQEGQAYENLQNKMWSDLTGVQLPSSNFGGDSGNGSGSEQAGSVAPTVKRPPA